MKFSTHVTTSILLTLTLIVGGTHAATTDERSAATTKNKAKGATSRHRQLVEPTTMQPRLRRALKGDKKTDNNSQCPVGTTKRPITCEEIQRSGPIVIDGGEFTSSTAWVLRKAGDFLFGDL